MFLKGGEGAGGGWRGAGEGGEERLGAGDVGYVHKTSEVDQISRDIPKPRQNIPKVRQIAAISRNRGKISQKCGKLPRYHEIAAEFLRTAAIVKNLNITLAGGEGRWADSSRRHHRQAQTGTDRRR